MKKKPTDRNNRLPGKMVFECVIVAIALLNFSCFTRGSGQNNTVKPKSDLPSAERPLIPSLPVDIRYPQLFDRNLWIVDDYDRVLRTEDGGRSWVEIYTTDAKKNYQEQIRGLSFVNAQLGFLIEGGQRSSGHLLRTADGGKNWEKIGEVNSGGSQISLENCFFVDASHGWAVGELWSNGFGGNDPRIAAYEGVVFATTDGGQTWQQQQLSLPKEAIEGVSWGANDVVFRDRNRGWIVCSAGLIFSTADGGATWRPTAAEGVDYQRVTFLDDQFGWASYKYGNSSWGLSITTDGGQHWRLLSESFVFGTWPVHAAFLNQRHGFAISLGLYETQDQGQKWTKLSGGREVNAPAYNYLGRARDESLVIFGTQNNRFISGVSTEGNWKWSGTAP